MNDTVVSLKGYSNEQGHYSIPDIHDDMAAVWSAPESLISQNKSADYPIKLFPEIMGNAIKEVLEYSQTPAAMIGGSALSAASICCQGYADVSRDDVLKGPCSLYLITLGESGERKSTIDSSFHGPIKAAIQEKAKAMQPALDDYFAEHDAWEAEYNGIKDKIRAEAKAENSTQELTEKLKDIRHHEPIRPRVMAMYTSDNTAEGARKHLGERFPAIGVISDEGGAVFGSHGMGSETVSRTLSNYNIYWDGGTLDILRGGEGTVSLSGVRMTFAVMVQQAALEDFQEKSKGLAGGNGFFARCLVALPESTQGKRLYKQPPADMPALNKYINQLLTILEGEFPLNEQGTLEPPVVPLSPKAHEHWVKFFNTVETKLGPSGAFAEIKDFASKAADNAARMALIFEMVEQGCIPQSVGLENFNNAAGLVYWHLLEAIRFSHQINIPSDQLRAIKLDEWLIDRCKNESIDRVERSIIQRYGPRALRNGKHLDSALSSLDEAGRVRIESKGKKKVILVNPVLIGGES